MKDFGAFCAIVVSWVFVVFIGVSIGYSDADTKLESICKTQNTKIIKKDFVDLEFTCNIIQKEKK